MNEATTHPGSPAFRFDPRLAAGMLVILALAGVGLWFLFRHLASLDNSPEEHQRIGTPLFAGAVACFVGCVTAAKLSLPVSKAALVLAALAVVCWIAPTPFGITRLLSYGCIGVLIARHLVVAIASCRCVPASDVAADPATQRRAREKRRAAWFSVFGAITGGASLLMLIKADALGWAAAID